MATAYAAVVSLMHVTEKIQSYHARQPIFVDEQQMQLQSLNQMLGIFQDFLECYSHGGSEEVESLEVRIANAAHAAEDIIETHIVDDICDRAKGHEKRSSSHFSLLLHEVIEGMNSIHEEVMEIQGMHSMLQINQLPRGSPSVPPSSPLRKSDVMVYDEELSHVVDKLLDQQTNRQVIPITGMGGIGKTTLAKIAYENLSVVSHFDIRGWVTISQQYDFQEILLRLSHDMHVDIGREEQHLGVKLHKHLFARRYLIVLDDMWSIYAWDNLKSFLPDKNNGSRVVITSRMLNLANNFPASNLYQTSLLDESKSWSLLCRKIFGEKTSPFELEDVGKVIAKNCKGLPLSIGAIGGLLSKSNIVREFWEYVAENTNKIVSSNDDQNCLNILSLSYSYLPIYLKPCFLYLGVFSEDCEIRVSKLIKLWVAEGLLKPDKTRSLEQVGKDYLKDLIDRNLLSVAKLGCTGNVKYFKIHDLVRDMCLGEAQKEKLLYIKTVYMPNISQGINSGFNFVVHPLSGSRSIELNDIDLLKGTNSERRIAIHLKSNEIYTPHDLSILQPTSFLRSLICDFKLDFEVCVDFRLLRVFDVYRYNCSEDIFQLINLRYLSFALMGDTLPSSICMLWNLETIIIPSSNMFEILAPAEIWKMPQLKHVVVFWLNLPDPPVSQVDGRGDVLENLQTVSRLFNLRCTDEVVRKIPNVVKLKLAFTFVCDRRLPAESLNNVLSLKKLQSLYCSFPNSYRNYLQDVTGFSESLRKLTLNCVCFSWEDITTKIGSLPHLEKLQLDNCSSGAECVILFT